MSVENCRYGKAKGKRQEARVKRVWAILHFFTQFGFIVFTYLDKLQQFMYRLLLTPKEVEKLKGLKEHSENNTTFDFYVNREAAAELRRLRDSELIIVKPPFRYISELEKASNYAKTDKDFIDLTQYCQLTKSGEEFLVKLEEMTKQNYEDNSSIQ